MGIENGVNHIEANKLNFVKTASEQSRSAPVSFGEIVIFCKNGVLRRASSKIEENKRLAQWGSETGYVDALPERQRRVVKERYGEEGLILSFEVLAERPGGNITRQAFHDADRRGIRGLQRAWLKVLYENPEKSVADIAHDIGCSRVTFYKRLKKEGIPVGRKRGRAAKPIPAETIKEMYWRQGLSPAEIGRQLGDLSRQTIWKRMILEGIERKQRNGSRKAFVA